MSEKVTIKKGTVQETLVFPLYGRSIVNEKHPQLFKDTEAKKIMARMDYDFSTANMGTLPSYIYGFRQEKMISAAKDYLAQNPDAIIVNLGCGLDTAFTFLDNGKCRYVNLDLPEVIALREKLFDLKERESNLAGNALDFSWMDKIGAKDGDKVLVISAGVLFYFHPEDVKSLIATLAKRFPGGAMVFDFENDKLVAMSNKMVKKSGNKGAPMYYALNDAKNELTAYSPDIQSVEILNDIPKEYLKIPFLPKLMFKIEFGKQMMGLARVNFKA